MTFLIPPWQQATRRREWADGRVCCLRWPPAVQWPLLTLLHSFRSYLAYDGLANVSELTQGRVIYADLTVDNPTLRRSDYALSLEVAHTDQLILECSHKPFSTDD